MSFISPDTIVPDPSVSSDLGRYAYVRRNPVSYTDPSGRMPLVPLIEGGTPVAAGLLIEDPYSHVVERMIEDTRGIAEFFTALASLGHGYDETGRRLLTTWVRGIRYKGLTPGSEAWLARQALFGKTGRDALARLKLVRAAGFLLTAVDVGLRLPDNRERYADQDTLWRVAASLGRTGSEVGGGWAGATAGARAGVAVCAGATPVGMALCSGGGALLGYFIGSGLGGAVWDDTLGRLFD